MTPLEERLFEIEQKWVQNAKDFRLFDAFDGACFCLRDARGFAVEPNEMDSAIVGFLECANDIPYLLEVLRLVLKIEHQAIDLIKREATTVATGNHVNKNEGGMNG